MQESSHWTPFLLWFTPSWATSTKIFLLYSFIWFSVKYGAARTTSPII
jgi:hypothetical protein